MTERPRQQRLQPYFQHPDFQIVREEPVGLDEALKLLEEFPPEDVRTEFVMGQSEGRQVCPPLVGFEDGEGAFVELATWTGGEYDLRVRWPRARRLWKLKWRQWREARVKLSNLASARQAVRRLFDGRYEQLDEMMGRLGRG